MRTLGVIPARYASSRLPGKVLCDIGGKTMLQRVYERARMSASLHEVVIATDDARVFDHAQALQAKAVMTSADHPSGTDRCYEAFTGMHEEYDAVVNIQGDEPFLDPGQIDLVCATLQQKDVVIATLTKAIADDQELDDPNEAHVVVDKDMNVLYFSRAALPYVQKSSATHRHRDFPYLKHVGVYAFRVGTLAALVKLKPSPLELAEGLEQLRWLENGHRIRAAMTTHDCFCVDTAEDLEEARRRVRTA